MNMFDIKSKKSSKKFASIGMEFDFSNPGIAYLGGGGGAGGGGGGGTVVQSTDPAAAMMAGNIQSASARQASQIYSNSIHEAISSLNNKYVQAQYAVQPYQQAGIASLDQLNQYLGLPSYNPGNAPTNPNTWNPSKQDIQSYVKANSYVSPVANDGHLYTIYDGLGSAYDGWSRLSGKAGFAPGKGTPVGMGPESGLDIIGFGGSGGVNASQESQIAAMLRENYVKENQGQYDINKANYDVNKGLYDQYSAQGPYDEQQITDKITNLPGYQAQLGQGIDAIGANASAKGYLGSGRILKELSNYGQNTLSQFYGDELSRLAGLVTQGSQTAQSLSSSAQQQGNSLAGLYNSLGQNQANSTLAGGNASAQGLISANQKYQVMGGGGGDGGLAGIGSILGGVGSIASAFL